MVQLIMLVLRLWWLTGSYMAVITYMAGLFPALVISLTDLPYFSIIYSILVSVVSTIKYFLSPPLFHFGITLWLLTPILKLGLYFSHKIATIGELAPSALNIPRDVKSIERNSK